MTEATSITKLLGIDVEGAANYTELEKVDDGCVAEKILKTNKPSAKCFSEFRCECCKFLVNMILKVAERSPFRCPVVRRLSCFCPREMPKTDIGLEKLKVLNCLTDNKLLSEHRRDTVCAHYTQFCQEKWHEL